VSANDVFQGAADAEFARDKGVRRVYVLHDNEAYGVGVATNFRNAARGLGTRVVGFEPWQPGASSYAALFEKVRSSRADAVFLAGLIGQNGGRVIEDKVAVLGPNNGDVMLLASDGFMTQQTIADAGIAADGMYVSAAGIPLRELSDAAQRFAVELAADSPGGRPLDPMAIYGAQAAQVMFDAIAKSDGTRRDVTAKLFESTVTDGLLGTFRFDANGDPAGATGAVIGFTIFKIAHGLQIETTIDPEGSTVSAAAHG
jgi:branched-chain amino acid transport system substrate-binding protein